MPTHCKVCARLDRADIDIRLARHQCNVSALAHELGINRKSLSRHRDQHLSGFLKVYGAQAVLPTMGELHGEYLRLHAAALDALALAEAGTLHAVDSDGREHRRVSVTAISAAVREARQLVDSMARLAADAADEHERPQGIGQGELTQRVANQLQVLMQRASDTRDSQPAVDSHPGAEVEGLALSPAEESPGRVAAAWVPPSPPQISLDAAMAISTEPAILPNPHLDVETSNLSEQVARVVEQDALSYEHQADRTVLMRVPNPRYPGSPASSAEERSAAGFPDVELTLSDLKARPDLLQRLVAEQRPPISSP